MEQLYFVKNGMVYPEYTDIQEVCDMYLDAQYFCNTLLCLKSASDYQILQKSCFPGIHKNALNYAVDNGYIDFAKAIVSTYFLINATEKTMDFILDTLRVQDFSKNTNWLEYPFEIFVRIINAFPELLEWTEIFKHPISDDKLEYLLHCGAKYVPQDLLLQIHNVETLQLVLEHVDIHTSINNTIPHYILECYCDAQQVYVNHHTTGFKFTRYCPNDGDNCTCMSGNILHILFLHADKNDLVRIVEYLSKLPTITVLLNEQNKTGNTPLHIYYKGCEMDKNKINDNLVLVILNSGFDTNLLNNNNETFFGMSSKVFDYIRGRCSP